MITILTIALGIALAAVLIVLMTGVTLMARGGEANRKWSNKLMRLRVGIQTIAILLLGALMFLRSH